VYPETLIVQAVRTNDHRGRHVSRLEDLAPGRDQLAVAGEDDGLGRRRRHIDRDLPSTVVVQRLGEKLTGDRWH
jgi:hypothetical protein